MYKKYKSQMLKVIHKKKCHINSYMEDVFFSIYCITGVSRHDQSCVGSPRRGAHEEERAQEMESAGRELWCTTPPLVPSPSSPASLRSPFYDDDDDDIDDCYRRETKKKRRKSEEKNMKKRRIIKMSK